MRLTPLSILAAALICARVPVLSAQVRDTKVITLEAAKQAVTAAEAEARKSGWNMSIAVVDPAGELIAFERMDDAAPSSLSIAPLKARTAAHFRRPTKALEDAVAGGRTVLLSFEGYALVEGGVPITIDGKIVGAIGASGGTSAQDGQVAQAGAGAVKR